MSDVIRPERASLWREGLYLFRDNWLEWAKWAVCFFAVMAALQVIAFDPSTQETLEKITKAHAETKASYTAEEKAALMRAMLRIFASIVPVMIISIVQAYAYLVFFMKRQQPVIGTPVLSVGRFFYWIWKNLQVVLLIFAAAFVLVGIPAAGGMALVKMKPIVTPVAVIVGLIGLGCVFVVSYRLALVSPLAIGAMEPVLKTSWKLMKGNCWRLFGNGLLLLLIVGVFYAIAAIAEGLLTEGIFMALHSLMPQALPPPETATAAEPFFMQLFKPSFGSAYKPLGEYIHLVFATLNLCVLTGLVRAYYCAVLRVLYKEHQATATPTG